MANQYGYKSAFLILIFIFSLASLSLLHISPSIILITPISLLLLLLTILTSIYQRYDQLYTLDLIYKLLSNRRIPPKNY